MTRFLVVLVAAALVGCGNGSPSSGDASTPPGDLAGGGSSATCQTAGDCRLYSSYCVSAPCQCIAIGVDDVDPPCVGGHMTCIVDPCNGKVAACNSGKCAITQ